MQNSKAFVFSLLCLVAAACGHGTSPVRPSASPDDAAAEPKLSDTELEAQGRYQKAERVLQRGLYEDAIKDFEAIRTEFPYSRFAAQSELRIADTYLKRGQQLEAIDAYRAFLRFHPSHPEAAYALAKVGEAYYAQIPKDFWLMPPAAEKDLGHVKEAITAYQDLLARYPGAQDAEGVQRQLGACRKKLADHEMYVARFYFTRMQWAGAVLRLSGLLHNFSGVGYDAEALYLLAQAHSNLGQLDQALASVTQLLADYPDTQEGRRGGRLLEQLEGRLK